MLPLPNRPLECRANGVWDPIRKTFYPWIPAAASTTIPGKPGIHYMVHWVNIAGRAIDAPPLGYADNVVSLTAGGVKRSAVIMYLGPGAAGSLSERVDVLCDPDTDIEYANVSMAVKYLHCIIAEIPADTVA